MPPASRNRLLSALSPADFERIAPGLHSTRLRDGAPLRRCGERVYFPETGICSVQSRMTDGRTIEIAVVGSEGALGMLPVVPAPAAPLYVQVTDGRARYMSRTAFERELGESHVFKSAVGRYARSFQERIVRSAACNRLHPLQDRCCRWLLELSDAVGGAELQFAGSLLGTAMGAGVEDLTAVLRRLEGLRVLRVRQSSVRLTDRKALERLACGCYAAERNKTSAADSLMAGASTSGRFPDARRPKGAKVVQLRAGVICPRCGMAAGEGHHRDRDCVAAIDGELRQLMRRTKELLDERTALVRDEVIAIKAFLNSTNHPRPPQ